MKGILLVNKEEGKTSHDMVSALRRLTGIKKVGHTGTLDPMATGLLPLCLGKATRLASYVQGERKTYRAWGVLGKRTDTLDRTGQVLDQAPFDVSLEDLEGVLASYLGPLDQVPPMYSALKYKGRRLYDYAREGVEVQRKARRVHIYRLDLLDFDGQRFEFELDCSSGTYVRSLIDSIGQDLGTYAYMDDLVRTRVGSFILGDAHKVEDLATMTSQGIEGLLLPMERAVTSLDRLDLDPGLEDHVRDGKLLESPDLEEGREYAVFSGDVFVGLGQRKDQGGQAYLHVHKVLI